MAPLVTLLSIFKRGKVSLMSLLKKCLMGCIVMASMLAPAIGDASDGGGCDFPGPGDCFGACLCAPGSTTGITMWYCNCDITEKDESDCSFVLVCPGANGNGSGSPTGTCGGSSCNTWWN